MNISMVELLSLNVFETDLFEIVSRLLKRSICGVVMYMPTTSCIATLVFTMDGYGRALWLLGFAKLRADWRCTSLAPSDKSWFALTML